LGIYHQGAYTRHKQSDLSNRRPGNSKEQEWDREDENSKHNINKRRGKKKKKKEKESGDLYDANSQAKKFPEQEDGFP